MQKKFSVNQFHGGLSLDLNDLSAKGNTLSDALNATFISGQGEDLILQNDLGNIPRYSLSEGFAPVAIKSFEGIMYVASYNPATGEGELGTIPSMGKVNGLNAYRAGVSKNIKTIKTANESPTVPENEAFGPYRSVVLPLQGNDQQTPYALTPGERIGLIWSSDVKESVFKNIYNGLSSIDADYNYNTGVVSEGYKKLIKDKRIKPYNFGIYLSAGNSDGSVDITKDLVNDDPLDKIINYNDNFSSDSSVDYDKLKQTVYSGELSGELFYGLGYNPTDGVSVIHDSFSTNNADYLVLFIVVPEYLRKGLDGIYGNNEYLYVNNINYRAYEDHTRIAIAQARSFVNPITGIVGLTVSDPFTDNSSSLSYTGTSITESDIKADITRRLNPILMTRSDIWAIDVFVYSKKEAKWTSSIPVFSNNPSSPIFMGACARSKIKYEVYDVRTSHYKYSPTNIHGEVSIDNCDPRNVFSNVSYKKIGLNSGIEVGFRAKISPISEGNASHVSIAFFDLYFSVLVRDRAYAVLDNMEGKSSIWFAMDGVKPMTKHNLSSPYVNKYLGTRVPENPSESLKDAYGLVSGETVSLSSAISGSAMNKNFLLADHAYIMIMTLYDASGRRIGDRLRVVYTDSEFYAETRLNPLARIETLDSKCSLSISQDPVSQENVIMKGSPSNWLLSQNTKGKIFTALSYSYSVGITHTVFDYSIGLDRLKIDHNSQSSVSGPISAFSGDIVQLDSDKDLPEYSVNSLNNYLVVDPKNDLIYHPLLNNPFENNGASLSLVGKHGSIIQKVPDKTFNKSGYMCLYIPNDIVGTDYSRRDLKCFSKAMMDLPLIYAPEASVIAAEWMGGAHGYALKSEAAFKSFEEKMKKAKIALVASPVYDYLTFITAIPDNLQTTGASISFSKIGLSRKVLTAYASKFFNQKPGGGTYNSVSIPLKRDLSYTTSINDIAPWIVANKYQLKPSVKLYADSAYAGDRFKASGAFVYDFSRTAKPDRQRVNRLFAYLNDFEDPIVSTQYSGAKMTMLSLMVSYGRGISNSHLMAENGEYFVNMSDRSFVAGDNKEEQQALIYGLTTDFLYYLSDNCYLRIPTKNIIVSNNVNEVRSFSTDLLNAKRAGVKSTPSSMAYAVSGVADYSSNSNAKEIMTVDKTTTDGKPLPAEGSADNKNVSIRVPFTSSKAKDLPYASVAGREVLTNNYPDTARIKANNVSVKTYNHDLFDIYKGVLDISALSGSIDLIYNLIIKGSQSASISINPRYDSIVKYVVRADNGVIITVDSKGRSISPENRYYVIDNGADSIAINDKDAIELIKHGYSEGYKVLADIIDGKNVSLREVENSKKFYSVQLDSSSEFGTYDTIHNDTNDSFAHIIGYKEFSVIPNTLEELYDE